MRHLDANASTTRLARSGGTDMSRLCARLRVERPQAACHTLAACKSASSFISACGSTGLTMW